MKPSVTVIGLGPMGQAMVRVLLAAGHEVTVWNRTAARADTLVAEGAHLAATPADALRAADLTILSLTDYAAMYDILGNATEALAGRVLVNLSSDTPDVSRAAATWAAGHGAEFLVGGVMAPEPMVGTEPAYVFYSGDETTLAAHATTLGVIGTPRYVGADPGLAQLMYQAHLDVFLTTLAALAHATALVRTAGVSAVDFIHDAVGTISDLVVTSDEEPAEARAFDTGVHPGDLSTATMMGATARHILDTSAVLGVDTVLPAAVDSLYQRAIAGGHGKDNWTSIFEVIKAPESRVTDSTYVP